MRIKRCYLFLLAALCGGSVMIQCTTETRTESKAVPVIFDTDVGNDIDDVLALQMLLNYEEQGKVDLLGITISKAYPRVIEYVDAYCNFNGYPGIPMGYVYDGPNPEQGGYVSQTLDTLIDGQHILHPQRTVRDSLPEAYLLMRKLLAGQEDNSVVMIAVGPETNLARLLQSQPDEYSPLNGVELVSRKVKLLSVMAGLFTEAFDFPEWNVVQDLAATQTVFSTWPGQVVASGWETGNKLLYPHQSILHDFADSDKHPMCVSYKIYDKMPYDRQTWDLTSVLYAIEPDQNHFQLSQTGRVTIGETGKSVFVADPAGKHRFLTVTDDQAEKTLNALVSRITGKEK